MIKHHPTFELLKAFVEGELPASLAAGIAIHADMCPKCQAQIAELTEQVAARHFEFEEAFLDRFIVDEQQKLDDIPDANFDQLVNDMLTDMADNATDSMADDVVDNMINEITASDEIATVKVKEEKVIQFNNQRFNLPPVLSGMAFGKTAQIGKLSRTRINLEEDEIRTSLLHIQPGGSVPEHTHKGFELTLLLDGSFTDDKGTYVKGDFIMLDASHTHQPVSEQGCLCYTVSNAAQHFTQGINRLLNPIGSFIY